MNSQPQKPFVFFVDADTVAYLGAQAAEQIRYQWINKDGRKSPKFYNAKSAARFIDMETLVMDEEGNVTNVTPQSLGWVRHQNFDVGNVQEAIKAAYKVIDDIEKTCHKFARVGKQVEIYYFLTGSTQNTDIRKTKDIDGTENRYQAGRKDRRKPYHLKAVRDYLVKHCGFRMSPKGVEADEPVIAVQALGDKGCALSCDKDLRCIEGSWFVNLNDRGQKRKLEFASEMGTLYKKGNKVKGLGFKYFCYQIIGGDNADGYKGLMGYGDNRVYDLLKDVETKQEAMETLLKAYKYWMKDGKVCAKTKKLGLEVEAGKYRYQSWDGQDVIVTPIELLQQHAFLAYQRRTPDDVFNVKDYIDENNWN